MSDYDWLCVSVTWEADPRMDLKHIHTSNTFARDTPITVLVKAFTL